MYVAGLIVLQVEWSRHGEVNEGGIGSPEEDTAKS